MTSYPSMTFNMNGGQHKFQWGQTPNALYTFCDIAEKCSSSSDKYFLQQNVFATEKLDGTNVAKDETGQMYGRRCFIDRDRESYQKTSLKKVKQADINNLKIYLCNEVSVDQDKIKKFLLYGELMCNSGKYDYNERDIVGEWMVFGAMIDVATNCFDQVFEKLYKAGFAVAPELDGEKIRIFASTKFFALVTKCGMKTVNVISSSDSISQIVSTNLEDMKRGKLEGIIFTIISHKTNAGYKVVKWKGAHEVQPGAVQNLSNVVELIKNKNIIVVDEVKMFYNNLVDVAFVGSDTNPLVKNSKNKKHINNNNNNNNNNNINKKTASSNDKKMIIAGIYHSMDKFDDIAHYSAKGSNEIEKYIKLLQDESMKHYIEEKLIGEDFEDKENVTNFINSSVVSIVNKMHKII